MAWGDWLDEKVNGKDYAEEKKKSYNEARMKRARREGTRQGSMGFGGSLLSGARQYGFLPTSNPAFGGGGSSRRKHRHKRKSGRTRTIVVRY